MALFVVHSNLESHGDQMYLICFVIVIMAGFDDDDFSLSGLTQEGHEFDVTVISSSSDDHWNAGLWLVEIDLSPSRHFSFMADGSVVVNEINFECNFRAFPMRVQCSMLAN